MIKNPEIPTDNLYKFISIFGLIIFIFSIYSLFQTQATFFEEIANYSEQHSKILETKTKNFSHKLFIEEKIKLKKMKIKSITILDPTIINEEIIIGLFRKNPQFENDLLDLEKLKLELMLLTDEENSNEKRLNTLNIENHTNPFLIPITSLMIIGFLSVIIGFRLWYTKTQVHIDRQLAKN